MDFYYHDEHWNRMFPLHIFNPHHALVNGKKVMATIRANRIKLTMMQLITNILHTHRRMDYRVYHGTSPHMAIVKRLV